MSEFYVFQTEQKANACANALNNQPYYPVIGKRKGKLAPDSQKTVRWTDGPMLMTSGEWAVPRPPSAMLDYVGVPEQSRADFRGVYGDDIRELTGADFPRVEI